VINNFPTLVEITGDFNNKDEWNKLRDNLLTNHLNLNTKYFDLSNENRELTDNKVVSEAIEVSNRHEFVLLSPLAPDIDLSSIKSPIICSNDNIESFHECWKELTKELPMAAIKDQTKLEEFLNTLD